MQHSRVRVRKMKNIIKSMTNAIRFKVESFSFAKIVTLMGVLIGYMSLIMTWIDYPDESFSSNAFNNVNGISAYIIVVILFIILFLLFSLNKKEKIKKTTNIIFRDYIIILFIAIITFILSITNLGAILGLRMFSADISHGSGIIILIISSILIFIGGILLKNEKNSIGSIYLNDSRDTYNKSHTKNSTQLPF